MQSGSSLRLLARALVGGTLLNVRLGHNRGVQDTVSNVLQGRDVAGGEAACHVHVTSATVDKLVVGAVVGHSVHRVKVVVRGILWGHNHLATNVPGAVIVLP